MVKIFIEGKECNFLDSYIKHIIGNKSIYAYNFKSVGGWDKLKNLDNQLIDDFKSGNKIIITRCAIKNQQIKIVHFTEYQ